MSDLGAPFIAALPVDGVSISVISPSRASSTVSASDATATSIDSLQVDLGEGPRWVAFASGVPVLISNTAPVSAHLAWPMFGAALRALPVRALYSYPLIVGVVVVGVADLYSSTAQERWSDRQRAVALRLASASAGLAVRLATRSAASEHAMVDGTAEELRRELHQATGMLVVLLDVSPAEAVARLEGHAFSSERPLLDVAQDVLARKSDLTSDRG